MGVMDLFRQKPSASQSKAGAAHPVGSPNESLRHIPSFNEFAGDTDLAFEADAECDRGTDDTRTKAPPAAADERAADIAPEPDIWRSTFDPGSNPNMHRVGRQVFDHVPAGKRSPTTWDYIIRGEQRKATFEDLDAKRKGFIEEADMKAAFDGDYDTTSLLYHADTDKDGRISRQEFEAAARSNAVAVHQVAPAEGRAGRDQ